MVIHGGGIDVIAKGFTSDRKTVIAADLEQTLVELPVAAWPYGRVAAVQEASIVAADLSDQKPIDDNLDATLAILKNLRVTVVRWPS